MRKSLPSDWPPYLAVPFASYREVAECLRELETASILAGRPSDGTVSLDSMARCLHELGRPDHAYRSIHITGTNGKTTVSRMIAALLQAGGRSVGLFTSAVHGEFRERITLNGRAISEQEFVDACSHVKRFMDWQGVRLTSFEFLSATAFFAFRAARVDYAVIEVGVGGRQDATNVIAPDVALITNVDYDHMDVLGHTLEAIAAEKAGIIKPFTPIVCGTMPDGPRDVVLARAKALQAPVLQIGRDYDVADYRRSDFSGRCNVRVGDRFWSDVPLSSPAGFVATNAAHALAVYEVLSCRGLVPDLDAAMVRAVFQRVDLSHSCEVVPGEPMVLLDGSHNAPAAANLAAVLRHTCEGRRTVLLVSLAADKDYRTMLKHLAEAGVDRAVFTHYPEQGTVEPQHLADGWRPWSQAAAEIVAAPDRAFARARQAAGPRGVVVVTGSTHLAAYCRSLLHSVVPEALPAV
jgi:dihydrofolate synthase / folylpolyglutamate synthase